MVEIKIFANQYFNTFETKLLFQRKNVFFKVLKLGECTAKLPLDFIRPCIKF